MKYTKVWMIKMDVKSLCTRHGCAPMNSRCLVYCVKIEWDAVYLFKD